MGDHRRCPQEVSPHFASAYKDVGERSAGPAGNAMLLRSWCQPPRTVPVPRPGPQPLTGLRGWEGWGACLQNSFPVAGLGCPGPWFG